MCGILLASSVPNNSYKSEERLLVVYPDIRCTIGQEQAMLQ